MQKSLRMRARLLRIVLMLAAALLVARTVKAQVAARLSSIRGVVEVQHGRQPARRVRWSLVVQNGDVVMLHPGASADLLLIGKGLRYRLMQGSSVRVEASELRPLSGPVPELQIAERGSLLTPLLDARGLGDTIRAMDRDIRFGPRAPSPLFAVRDSNVTLHWSGPLDPVVLQESGTMLHVRIQTLDRATTVLSQSVALETTELSVPAGTLHPGQWYVWSVTVDSPRASGQTCGGPLLLLTSRQKADLETAERRARKARQVHLHSARVERKLGRVYERFGMVPEALSAYEIALHIRPDRRTAQAAARLRELLNRK